MVFVQGKYQKNEDPILVRMEKEKLLIYTPITLFNGNSENCDDDECFLNYALKHNSIIISNDQFIKYRSFHPSSNPNGDKINKFNGKFDQLIQNK